VTVLKSSAAPIIYGGGKPSGSFASQKQLSWVRPSDWLTLTAPSASEQKFVGLFAVFNQSHNHVALRASVSSGTYTVDWGDGTSPQTYTSNTTAEYNYSYSSLNSNTLSSRGYRQAIVTVTPTTSGATFSSFGLNYRHSARSSSSTVAPWLDVAISAPNATTVRLGGYDSGGATVAKLSYLEQATFIAHSTTNMSYMFRECFSLQSVPLFNTASVTNMSYMFQECRSLQSVPLFNTASVTNMSYMFQECRSLQSVPLFNTASVTNMSYMFNGCYNLQSVPLFNTASVTTMSFMFYNCYNLQSVPLFNTAAVTNMSYMFSNCSSLQSVPLFNTDSVTTMSNMFNGCYNLQSVPLFSTAAVTTMRSMFDGCSSLQSVPLFNTAAVTDMSTMLASTLINTVPLFNTTLVTTVQNMLWTCTLLREIPELTLSAITSATNNGLAITTNGGSVGKAKFTGMRWTLSVVYHGMGATELDEMYTALAVLNPNVTNASGNGTTVTYTVDDISAFVAARTVTMTGIDPVAYNLTNATVASVNTANKTFTVTNAATGTYVSGGVATIQDNKTITVTGNPGTASDNPSIATNKGWTVTG
jgi:surface protein